MESDHTRERRHSKGGVENRSLTRTDPDSTPSGDEPFPFHSWKRSEIEEMADTLARGLQVIDVVNSVS